MRQHDDVLSGKPDASSFHGIQISRGGRNIFTLCVEEMAPSVPRTRAAAALRMKQIALDNQGRTIRCLRAQLATERRGLATTKKEVEDTQVALEASHKKFQARIQEAEDSMQAQHLIIEALVEEKDSLLQTIQGLQEANDAPAPFDGEWEEEPEEQPEEEEIEDIPLGEGEIDDE
ncbi:phragmoplast orienting kinesin 2 [Dorcoceras hygrometricum]|uniref:Phragmoplast orienting kinesin 2 n=1 Tax=Dorcoceras hygrometricum TaxID=472368 RepID=A0A2Z7CT77_9LAMI|nr:phragmoplast orienting kinesin 2 [Dorcoceras hygrometricum]